ncbi:MAG: DUF998 domain-containing protein [Bacteroidota bacterium]
MKRQILFWSGILGVILFTLTTVIGGILNPNYHFISQFISELYAVDAPNADLLRFYGYLPSGVFFILFAVFLHAVLPKSAGTTLGCILFGFGYGFGTIVCSIFNCDVGCNPFFVNPSLSQFIHNAMGMLTYLLTPIGLLCIGISVRKKLFYSNFSIVIAVLSFLFVLVLNVAIQTPYKGIIQRVIEGSFLIWIAYSAFYLSKNLINKSEIKI